MTVYEALEGMQARLTLRVSERKRNLFCIYTSGIIQKLKQAEHALRRIREYASLKDPSVTTVAGSTTSPSETSRLVTNDQLQLCEFYTDAFFSLLYSAFDVFAQVVNLDMKLGGTKGAKRKPLKENAITFARLEDILSRKYSAKPLTKECQRVRNSHCFKWLTCSPKTDPS